MPQLVDSSVLERFQNSLDRCTVDQTFLQRFYARFLLTSEEIAERFEGVDLKRQTHVLRTSLYMVVRAASGFEDGIAHLQDIARTHSKDGYDIKPAFYEHWLEALLAAAAETDPDFDDETADAWTSILRPCIDIMIAKWDAE